jgi:Holliday junction resolvase
MMSMGPQGFVFEKYIAKILDKYGYSTKVGQILKGCCVDHEVDVVAKKDNMVFFIESKYHNHRGTYSDVKTALYVHARFVDIEKAIKKKKDSNNTHYYGWLVTNTKCTSEAVKYSECVKLRILAWQYPKVKNLQYYIERKKLYPISILTTITKDQKEALFDSGIILVQELVSMDADEIMRLLSIKKIKTMKILNEIEILLG